tara:strand:- start:463 stop:927 length:465 start_codon:yes stop_codon:yes gene_type:complete
MSAIPGVINGSDYLLKFNMKYIIYGTTASMSIANGEKDISCRETHNWKTTLLSDREWSMGFEGKFAYIYKNGTMNSVHGGIQPIAWEEIIDWSYIDQEKIVIEMYPMGAAGASGNPLWWGIGILSNISINAPNEDSSTVTMEIRGCGELAHINF